MGKYEEILETIKNAETFGDKIQIARYFLNVIDKIKDDLYPDDRADISEFAFDELKQIPTLIEEAESYKVKSEIFAYEDALLGFLTLASMFMGELPQEKLEVVDGVVNLVNEQMFLENAVETLFSNEEIGLCETKELLELASGIEEEFHRGLLYVGLAEYKENFGKLSDDAWKAVSDYLLSEFERYSSIISDLTEDQISNIEYMSDVAKYFLTDSIVECIRSIMNAGHNNINYYALDTLVSSGKEVSTDVIKALANDLEYAELTYDKLKQNDLERLFPRECATEEYLATSNMVRWLVFPTELGKKPDEIELLGKVKVKGEKFHIFRFRSDSDTLDDNLKNKWLVGWSSDEGGTFSNFDEYELFEKKTVEKTVKNIKKKLIG